MALGVGVDIGGGEGTWVGVSLDLPLFELKHGSDLGVHDNHCPPPPERMPVLWTQVDKVCESTLQTCSGFLLNLLEVTLVKITQVSGVRFYNTLSMFCIVCSPPQQIRNVSLQLVSCAK